MGRFGGEMLLAGTAMPFIAMLTRGVNIAM